MPIDHDIYSKLTGMQADIVGAKERGMRMRDLTDQRALEKDQRLKAESLEKQKRESEMIVRAGLGVKDQDTYAQALGGLSKAGIDVSQMPQQYDKRLVDGYLAQHMSVTDQLGMQRHREDLEARGEDRKAQREFQGWLHRDRQQEKRDAKAEKEKYEKSTEGRLSKLNSGDKARYDNSRMGLQAVQSLDAALVNGNNTFSLVGDNDYTLNLDHAAEAFGRMQSGGAINKDEEARFKRMAPTATDSKAVQKQKLEKMQALFGDRLRTLGFTADEAGVPLKPIAYGNPDPKAKAPSAAYDQMSDAEIAALYAKRMKGANAKP